jgi:hypothetical protein
VRDDDTVPSGFVDIVDMSAADHIVIEPSDAVEIIALVSEVRTTKGLQGTIFFAPSDHSFGMAQMFQQTLASRDMSVEIFRDWNELAAAVMARLRDDKRWPT